MDSSVAATRPPARRTGPEAAASAPASGAHAPPGGERWLPQLLISPAFLVSLLFFYGLALWVVLVSFVDSEGFIQYKWVGLRQYQRLWADENWWLALWNLLRYLPIVVGASLVLGCVLAILLDQKVRFEGGFRTLYLYPLALSWIVSGTIWRWLLSPDLGVEAWLHGLGWQGAVFDWIVRPDRAIFAMSAVAVWHATGFVMAMFIAGLRAVDDSVFKAAMIDGASLPRIYWRIVLPTLRPTVFSAVLILLPAALKTFDLVVVLTQGGPGQATVLPAFYMFDRFFRRDQMGLAAASGSIILMMSIAIAVPYIVRELRRPRHD
ncbi:sugar ABC transporter permease [Verminephrobacter aporrectodeae subsp. tuberculatae]|nr:sugar ABC transporter permease [Verminephrobacter aporrectodeae]MCW5222235.1 sugar ABC transporter permease [Verminephrobacter aporrectodeae subsp. tuberculatae]MCW5287699.1 sugar ABC transporter permease [Verminephrobacter aporrectodeae subsp. tuberculatae]